jgi:hypothetical protein
VIGFLLAAGMLCAAGADEDWAEVWRGLAELEALPPEAGPARAAAGLRLEGLAAARDDPWRRELLAYHLESLAGGSPAPVSASEEWVPVAGEAWVVARALPPGEAADAALTAAVAEVPEGAGFQRCLVLGFERFGALCDAYETDPALRMGLALHERARAPWSAGNLGRLLGRLGRAGEGRAVLSEQLARESEPAVRLALRDDRGLLALGAGDWAAARGDLGFALAAGSPSAQVVVGQRALAWGRLGRARVLFRPGVGSEPPHSWALRGWGLSMLAREGADYAAALPPVTDPSSRDR